VNRSARVIWISIPAAKILAERLNELVKNSEGGFMDIEKAGDIALKWLTAENKAHGDYELQILLGNMVFFNKMI